MGHTLRRLNAVLGRSPAVRSFPSRLPTLALDRIWVQPVDRARAARGPSQSARVRGVGPSSRARRGAGCESDGAREADRRAGRCTAAFFAAVVWLLQRRAPRAGPARDRHRRCADCRPRASRSRSLLTAVAYAVVASYDRLAARYARVRLPAGARFRDSVRELRVQLQPRRDRRRAGIPLAALFPGRRRCEADRRDRRVLDRHQLVRLSDGARRDADRGSLRSARRLGPLADRGPSARRARAGSGRRVPGRAADPQGAGPHPREPLSGAEPRFALAQVGLGSAYWLLVPLVDLRVAAAGSRRSATRRLPLPTRSPRWAGSSCGFRPVSA